MVDIILHTSRRLGLGFWGSGVLGFWGSGFWGSGVLGFWVLGFWGSGRGETRAFPQARVSS